MNSLQAEVDRLNAIINTPQSDDFLRAVSTEAEHQRQRWGNEHDAGKAPADWFWLVGFLAGKALHAHSAGDMAKAEHHIITAAAALRNWHLFMFGGTDMRPGIDGDAALRDQQTGRAENTAAITANPAVNTDRAQIIARAVAAHGREWPEQLTSGVMFYDGERITKDEFMAEVRT